MAFPAPVEVARWLGERFASLPDEYEGGRQAMASALMLDLCCSAEEAASLLDELEVAGYLRYAAEARSPGGSPGTWIVYASPADNPIDAPARDRGRSSPP